MFNFVNKYYIYLLIVIAGIMCVVLTHSYVRGLQHEMEVLSNNNYVLSNSITEVTTKYNNNVVITQAMILKSSELEKDNKALYGRLKELGIKYKDVDGVAQLQAKEIKQLKLRLKDSIVYINTKDTIITDTLRCFDFKDTYTTLTGCVASDSVDINYEAQVPIDIVLENVYKHKFLWFKWNIISRKLYVTSDNKSIKFTNIKLYIPN